MEPPSTGGDPTQYPKLCLAAGNLFITFAALENAMNSRLKLHLAYLINPAGEDPFAMSIGLAIYGSMRFKTARDTMKRIMVVEKAPKAIQDAVQAIFNQIGEIEKLRDLLAHQALSPYGEPPNQVLSLMTLFTSRDAGAAKRYEVNETVVSLAANDLMTAINRTWCKGDRKAALFTEPTFDPSPIPWQYKPSMLKQLP